MFITIHQTNPVCGEMYLMFDYEDPRITISNVTDTGTHGAYVVDYEDFVPVNKQNQYYVLLPDDNTKQFKVKVTARRYQADPRYVTQEITINR